MKDIAMYLLTEWAYRPGKLMKLAAGQDLRTGLNEFRASWLSAKYFLVWPSHSVNKQFIIWAFCVKLLLMARGAFSKYV